jgi:myo-inositol 2-dehydrogenase/D-chiro-inositol 1-dehydrogenase
VVNDVESIATHRPDGIVVCANTAAHLGVIEAAARVGAPIFCEKPLSGTVAETKRIIGLTQDAGVPLQLGFQRRYDAQFRALREGLAGGVFGMPLHLSSCTLDPAPPPPGYVATSGGIFVDCCIHDIDLIRWVSGLDIVAVSAGGTAREQEFRDADDVDTAHALLELENGVLATIAATRHNAAGYDVRFELHGTRGAAVAGMDDRTPVVLPGRPVAGAEHPPYRDFLDRFEDAYREEMADFTRIMRGGDVTCTGRDSLEAQYIAEACEVSRRAGRRVTVDEIRRRHGELASAHAS